MPSFYRLGQHNPHGRLFWSVLPSPCCPALLSSALQRDRSAVQSWDLWSFSPWEPLAGDSDRCSVVECWCGGDHSSPPYEHSQHHSLQQGAHLTYPSNFQCRQTAELTPAEGPDGCTQPEPAERFFWRSKGQRLGERLSGIWLWSRNYLLPIECLTTLPSRKRPTSSLLLTSITPPY